MPPTSFGTAAGLSAPSIFVDLGKLIWEITQRHLKSLLTKSASTREDQKRAVFRIFAWNENSSSYATGTAFLIHSRGLVITNFHVIEGFSHFTVNIPNADTGCIEKFSADPVLVAPEHDLALLFLNQTGREFPNPLPISPDTHSVEEDVVAIGFPACIYQAYDTPDSDPVCTFGKINKLEDSEIVHGATISPGNSGGPLISHKNGTVIGVNTWTTQSERGGVFFIAIPARHILDLLRGKCGMSYADYLARYAKENARQAKEERHNQIDNQASDIILNHMEFITGKTYSSEPEEVYARDLVDIDRNATMHREEFVKSTLALDKTWPSRHYHLVSAKRSGDTLEVLCQYYLKSRKGKEESGYSMITLVTTHGLITAFSEKRSNRPIKHTSRYKKIDYQYPPDYYAYPSN